MNLYKTYRWQQKRKAQLRIQPLCVYCQKQGKVKTATVADHITPHKGNEIAFWNNEIQSLCKHCHDSIKQREEHGLVMNVTGIDGWTINN